jgi:hypothetical protein
MVTAVGGLDEVDMVGNTKTERGEEEEGKKSKLLLSLFSSSLEERVKKTPRRGRSDGRIVRSVFSSLFFFATPSPQKEGKRHKRFSFLLREQLRRSNLQALSDERNKKRT